MSLRADSKDQTVEEPPFREMAPLAAAKAAKKAKKKAASSKEPPPKSRAVRAPAWRKRALALAAARDGSYPATFEPQLATLRPEAPQGEKWLHEIKWDGYRLLAAIDEGKAHLRSRNGLDWSSNYPGIVAALESLGLHEARFDGELVALDRAGKSDFSSLVQTIKSGKTEGLSYVIFDMPGIEGVDLSQTPLVERKGLLRDLMAGQDDGPLSFSEHVLGRGPEAFEASRATGVEGIVCKSVDAPYEPGRSATWLKVKHEQTDDFFVVGFTSPLGGRSALGALLLARTTETGLEYVGKVGTGFDTATLKELLGRLEPLIQKVPPVSLPVR